eukprot:381365_1
MGNKTSNTLTNDKTNKHKITLNLELLICGYIGHQLNKNVIPMDVILICIQFWQQISGGWMTVKQSKHKSWIRGWFICDNKEIKYCPNPKTKHNNPNTSISFSDIKIMSSLNDQKAKKKYKKKNVIVLYCRSTKWILTAKSKEEKEIWFNRLVQTAPNVSQQFCPFYQSKLSYRKSKEHIWKNGYFGLDSEYLFLFEDKECCDTFKSSVYYEEDLYTIALSQCVQGLIPLQQSTIKELDRCHPACSGKHRFVFCLKTNVGKFYLSSASSLEMDAWLDAIERVFESNLYANIIKDFEKNKNKYNRQ